MKSLADLAFLFAGELLTLFCALQDRPNVQMPPSCRFLFSRCVAAQLLCEARLDACHASLRLRAEYVSHLAAVCVVSVRARRGHAGRLLDFADLSLRPRRFAPSIATLETHRMPDSPLSDLKKAAGRNKGRACSREPAARPVTLTSSSRLARRREQTRTTARPTECVLMSFFLVYERADRLFRLASSSAPVRPPRYFGLAPPAVALAARELDE